MTIIQKIAQLERVTKEIICLFSNIASPIDGKSAYQIAIENNFEGSEEEWLESLIGETGKSAYELAVELGQPNTATLGEWLASLQGTNAQSFNYKGELINYADLPPSGNIINDAYYNIDDNLLYVYNGTSFPIDGNGISFGSSISDIFDPTTETEAQGGKQIYAFTHKEHFEKGFRRTGNLFDKNDIKSGFYQDLDGNEYPLAVFSYSNYIAIKPSTKYAQNAPQTRNFYDENLNHIIGFSDSLNVWESPVNSKYVTLNVALGNLEVFVLSESETITDDTSYSPATIEGVLSPIYKTILHSDTSYNSIRTLAESLFLKADYYNRYEISLFEGTYTETDWKGFGKYVRIKGENRDGTFINFDGNSSNILPDDYSFAIFSGQVASSVERGAKHIVFLMRDFHCENLTFFADNCKYPIHSDNAGFKKAEFLNCRIKEKDCNYPIGIGIWGGQSLRFENCILERGHFHTRLHAFLYHNSTRQSENSLVEFINCKMLQCGGAVVYENGSNKEDVLNVINCQTDSVFEIEYGVSQDADGKTFWTNHISGVKVENPANIPYNIKLNTLGSNIDLIYDSPHFVGFPSSRPLFYKHIISDYIGLSQNFEAVQKGDLVSKIGDAGHNTANRTVKYNTSILSLPPIGVALHDAGVNEPLYFSKVGKIGKVKFSGGGISDYNGNTRKLVFNETSKVFESNPSISWKDADAIAYENTAVDGLIMALVKSF